MQLEAADKLRAITKQINYATLATVTATGEPWNTPVYFASDDELTIYWGSHVNSQHSKNVRENGQAFIVIYNSTVLPGTGEGVYIKARCEMIEDPADIARAYELIQKRRLPIPYWDMSAIEGGNSIGLFRATPEKIWMNDGSEVDGTYIDIRKEVEL